MEVSMKLKKLIPILCLFGISIFTMIQFFIIIIPFRLAPVQSDVIIVLGARLYGDKPSPMLQYRLEKTLALYNEGFADTIIVSGARGDDELITEALAMKIYLMNNGVPEGAILEEDHSYSTYENLSYSNAIMKEKNLKSAIIVSNSFHMSRALMIAKRLDISASGAAAKNYPNIFLTTKYYIREVFACVKDFMLTI